MMDAKKIAGELLGMVRAAAPLFGMAEEVAAAEAVLTHARRAFEALKPVLASDDAAALEQGLAAAFDRMNAHADRTAGSLG